MTNVLVEFDSICRMSRDMDLRQLFYVWKRIVKFIFSRSRDRVKGLWVPDVFWSHCLEWPGCIDSYLNDNHLTGPIPAQLSQLRELEILWVPLQVEQCLFWLFNPFLLLSLAFAQGQVKQAVFIPSYKLMSTLTCSNLAVSRSNGNFK